MAGFLKSVTKYGSSNRHPVDELADVRERIKHLKNREEEIRQMIIDGKCDKQGDYFFVVVRVHKTERIDTPAIIKEMGMERLRRFMKTSSSTWVSLRSRDA